MTTAKRLLRFIDPHAGPITKITSAPYPGFFQRTWWHSSAFLHKEIYGGDAGYIIFNEGSGGGWSRDKEESQVKAVVEAVERWAFYHASASGGKHCGIDIDPTTNGFAALPESFGVDAVRASAYCEAIERWLLDRIWYSDDVVLEKVGPGKLNLEALFGKDSARVSIFSARIKALKFSAISGKEASFCLALFKTEYGGVLPGSACGLELDAAVEHAVIELYNHYLVFRKMQKRGATHFDNIIEARLHHFASTKIAGDTVEKRIRIGTGHIPVIPDLILSDTITGPWNPEVNVHRVLLDDSVPFMRDGLDRFLI